MSLKITIITQNEPFYLAKNLSYLLSNLPKESKVVSCVITKASPFGKKKRFVEKVMDSYKVFGFQFFIYYFYSNTILLILFHNIHILIFRNDY